MERRQAAYDLAQSQVATPEPVVTLFWKLMRQFRGCLGTVLDLGAADGRFAKGGSFDRYLGVEIDRTRIAVANLPRNGKIINGCVFRHKPDGYDACIGNPPYARHHDIESPWKENTAARLERELAISLDKHCNLYIYFFCLALLKTHSEGLVSLLIPYEWVSRPSAQSLRQLIQKKRWNVSVYRFQMALFKGVMTTASISVVDKARRNGCWKYYDITTAYNIVGRDGVTNSKAGVLGYEPRGKIWSLRGLSPGSQKVFTLTERERVDGGLLKRDVVPCVTTLRHVPRSLRLLSKAAFHKHFISAGQKCWLIRSNEVGRSRTLNRYLKAVPRKNRQTYTCKNQRPWFKYLSHPVPRLLLGSGFTKFGPKILVNSVNAYALGSVWGVHSRFEISVRRLQQYLLKINFENRVVAHAKTLKKVEVRQLNAVLNAFAKQEL